MRKYEENVSLRDVCYVSNFLMVRYFQRYEAMVNQILEEKSLINGFSRLLNIVSPVDNTICTFPPSLFNIQG